MRLKIPVFISLLAFLFIGACSLFDTNRRFNPNDPEGEPASYFPYLTNTLTAKNVVFTSPVNPANPYVFLGQKISLRVPAVWNGKTLSNFRFDVGSDGVWETGWQSGRTYFHAFTTSGVIPVTVEGIYQNAVVYRFPFQKVRVLSGGSGSFVSSQDVAPGVSGSSTALGDIDGDGDLDLVMTGFDGSARHFKTYLNNGSGTFTLFHSRTPTLSASSLALGDLDGDGDLDLVISGDNGGTKFFLTFLNEGDGSFSQSQVFSPGLSLGSLALGDLDADGDPDLVATGDDGSTKITKVFQNNGSGFFSLHQSITPGVCDSAIALGDLNNDGSPDLVLTGFDGTSSYFKTFTNSGAGAFFQLQNFMPSLRYAGVVLGDLDKDGFLDMIIAGAEGGTDYFRSYFNNGAGVMSLSQTLGVGVSLASLVLGDLNGDGDLDLVISGSEPPAHTTVFQNNGRGVFTAGQTLTPEVSGGSLNLGDLDQDGDLDLVSTGFDGSTRYFKVYKNQ